MGEMILVILAAGDGGRLGQQKALLKFNFRSLLWHIIDAFATIGPYQLVVIVGYRFSKILTNLRLYPEEDLEFIFGYNESWATTRTGDSLLAARQFWEGHPCVVASADHLFGPRLAAQLMDGPPTHVLADGNLDLDGEETVLFGTDDGRVERLVFPASTMDSLDGLRGECPELFKVSADDSLLLAQHLKDCDVFEAVNQLPDVRWSHTDEPWIEIDTPKDLERAWGVWERIEANGA